MSRPAPLTPARPAALPDGTLYSPQYDDVYASAAGALAEAHHVFLAGNGLPQRWRGCRRFVIVETGFGAGLNFLATWREWRASAPPDACLHYLSAEKHPFEANDIGRLTSGWPQVAALGAELRAQYPPLLPGFHRLQFDGARVTLTLLFGDALDTLRQLRARADAFYLDGFAPAKNPDMWSAPLLRELVRLANPGATAATYTVAAAVRSRLDAVGFAVERREGFARKREMLVARFVRDSREACAEANAGRAIVIGAGLAGTCCAAQLGSRGWQVELLERRNAPAQEASGNHAGLLMPAFSLDWNPPTRLTVPAFVYALRWLGRLGHTGGAPVWTQSGVLQLARDQGHLERQRSIKDAFALPDDIVSLVDREGGAALCGAPVAAAGWWFRSAGWADPAGVCRANLAAAGEAVLPRFDCEVAQLRRTGEDWEALDAAGVLLARAPVVILANAHAARLLPGCEGIPLQAIRGQVSLISQRAERPLAMPVCREGYITPALHGMHCVGAGYDTGRDDPQPTRADHAANLDRVERLLPGFSAGLDPAALPGRVGFRTVSPDRLPLAGPVPLAGETGVFACLGLASRGMTWAPLLSDIVACCATGEPPPIERNVLDWLAPQRFATRLFSPGQAAV